MFKLNQLLIENSSRTKTTASRPSTKTVFSNFSIKIFQILEALTTNSEKLANNLLHILFNTRKFVEEKSSNNEYDLSKKLQDLVLHSGAKLKTGVLGKKRPGGTTHQEQFDILSEYYFKSMKLAAPIENNLFYLGLYKFLNSLLKVCILTG